MPTALTQNPEINIDSIKSYGESARREVMRVRRNLTGLSKDDKASLVRQPEEQIRVMDEAVAANQGFLEVIVEASQQAQAFDSTATVGRGEGKISSKSVQTFLQMCVREWSEEGLQERNECYERLLGALENHSGAQRDQTQASGSAAPRVLCPGAQLGRLPYEVGALGFQCEACETHSLLYFGSEIIRSAAKNKYCIQPFALGTCNRFKADDHVRRIYLPDVEKPSIPRTIFGDFLHLYGTAAARSTFDCVLTAFALDASANVLRFIRTVAHVVKPGGLWANFGPLAYEFDLDDSLGQAMELSWEELRFALSHFFDVREEAFIDSFYASNAESMMQMQYSCVYFFAVRNTRKVEGIGQL